MVKDLNIPPEEQQKVRDHIDSVLPDERIVYSIKTTPKFTELTNKLHELTQLIDSFHKNPDLFVTYTKSIIGND